MGNSWTSVNNTLDGNRSDVFSEITTGNISTLEEKFRTPLSDVEGGKADVYTNPTVTYDGVIYMTTQTQYTPQGIPRSDKGGEVMAISALSGEILWRRQVSEYSGVPFDFSRAAPAVFSQYIYIGTGTQTPQSIVPYESTLTSLFTGQLVGQGTGTRQSVICIDRMTGDLAWKTFVGETATTINDPDNWLYITQSPIVKRVYDADQNARDVVIVGSSSGQSFVPSFYTNDYGGTNLPLAEQLNFQMTDVGKVFFLDAITGELITTTSVGPPLLTVGDTVPSSSSLNGGGLGTLVAIRHLVTPEDLQEGGVLNPVQPQYGIVETFITYILEYGNGSATIPAPLDGIDVVDTTNTIVSLAGGAPVSLTLDKVVVRVDAQFVIGRSEVVIGSTTYSTTDASTGLAGQTGLRPVRIGRVVFVGQTITDEETAYQLNYYGGSVWGNSIVSFEGESELSNDIFITTGQPHFLPWEQSTALNPPSIPTFFQSQQLIYEAQQNYINDPTTENYDIMQQTYDAYLESIQNRFTETLRCQRIRDFRFCSVIRLSLRPSDFGEITWSSQSTAYDYWLYAALNGRSVSYSTDPPTITQGYSSIELFLERPIGPDGDYGQGASLFMNEETFNPNLVTATKSGMLFTFELTLNDETFLPNDPTPVLAKMIGNPIVNGSSNYGFTLSRLVDTSTWYFVGIVTQAYFPTSLNPPPPSTTETIINFPFQLRWYTDPDSFYDVLQSSVVCYNLYTGDLVWQVPVIPDDTAPYGATLAQVSSSQDLVYIPGCDGRVYIRQLSDGTLVKTLTLDNTGGQSSPALVGDTVYLALGRAALGSNFNIVNGEQTSANYKPATHFFAFSFGTPPPPPPPRRSPAYMSILFNIRRRTPWNPTTQLAFFGSSTRQTTVSQLYQALRPVILRTPALYTLLYRRSWALFLGRRLLKATSKVTLGSLADDEDDFSSLVLQLVYFY